MRLIIEHYESDGCTYSCTDTIPVNHESPESLLCEIKDWANSGEDLYEDWRETLSRGCILGESYGESFEIFTLEEWWEANKV